MIYLDHLERLKRKDRSKSAAVRSTAVCDSFYAEHIELEKTIRNKWLREYGHFSTASRVRLTECSVYPYYVEQPIPQVTSDFRAGQAKGDLTAPIGWYNYGDHRAAGNVSGQAVGQLHEVKAPKITYDYPTSGNTQKHHVVQDHVTGYSSSFGHHSVQLRNQSQIYARKPTSANDLTLQIRSSSQSDGAVQPKYPYAFDKSKSRSPSNDSYGSKYAAVPFTPNRRVDLDELAMDLEGCTWAELQRRIESIHPLEICPKCENSLGCTCVPRRRETIPEGEPGNGPDDVLPPWPRQVWCGPSYNGLRAGTTGDLWRLRHHLSRDPEKETPMNRMYDEMKAVNYYGDKSHAGEYWYSCGPCRSANEAARGTWLDEQLRKGNPFTTGDTQFKSCGYMKKS